MCSHPGELECARRVSDAGQLNSNICAKIVLAPVLCISTDTKNQTKLIFQAFDSEFQIVNVQDSSEWIIKNV
jgi:hypothetical protein